MSNTWKIVIAEDHRILREGLKSLLQSMPAVEIVGEAENGLEAVKIVKNVLPDLILIDLSMPKMDGLTAISEIKAASPHTKVLVLTVHKAEEYVFEALKSGCDGYLLKDAGKAELKMALDNVLDGKKYLSPGISERVVVGYVTGKKPSQPDTAWQSLTSREKQVLKLVAEGNRNKDIADMLCISIKTVEKHRANLIRKLDRHSSSELTAYAMERGLVTR